MLSNLTEQLAAAGVCLPLRASAVDVGVILDADDFDVLTVDVNSTLSDAAANEIARLIVSAVNDAAMPANEVSE